jgi:hypothetical protein
VRTLGLELNDEHSPVPLQYDVESYHVSLDLLESNTSAPRKAPHWKHLASLNATEQLTRMSMDYLGGQPVVSAVSQSDKIIIKGLEDSLRTTITCLGDTPFDQVGLSMSRFVCFADPIAQGLRILAFHILPGKEQLIVVHEIREAPPEESDDGKKTVYGFSVYPFVPGESQEVHPIECRRVALDHQIEDFRIAHREMARTPLVDAQNNEVSIPEHEPSPIAIYGRSYNGMLIHYNIWPRKLEAPPSPSISLASLSLNDEVVISTPASKLASPLVMYDYPLSRLVHQGTIVTQPSNMRCLPGVDRAIALAEGAEGIDGIYAWRSPHVYDPSTPNAWWCADENPNSPTVAARLESLEQTGAMKRHADPLVPMAIPPAVLQQIQHRGVGAAAYDEASGRVVIAPITEHGHASIVVLDFGLAPKGTSIVWTILDMTGKLTIHLIDYSQKLPHWAL